MFLLDSLMISGLKWVMNTVTQAAEAEMNDDTALREQLLDAEMRREMGEISEDEFKEAEADLLKRIREIKERREGGSGPLAFGSGEALERSADDTFQVEASVSGDFYNPADAPHTTVIETEPQYREEIRVLDIDRPDRSARSPRSARSVRSKGRSAGVRSARTPSRRRSG